MLSHCIAIHGLYCKGVQWNGGIVLQYGGFKGQFFFFFILQYTWCIVARKGLRVENCIAIQLLYCDQQ